MTKPCLSLVVLISGNGSNLQAIIDAIETKQLNAEIKAVISNRADAYGLTRAKQHGIAVEVLSLSNYSDRQQYCHALRDTVKKYQPELIILAGFMLILGPEFVDHFPGRILNIHPSLLPKYRGLHTHEKALQNGDKEHGISIHFVTLELDGGPIICQARLKIAANETVEELKVRIQQLEHRIFPQIISWYAEKRLFLAKNHVMLDDKVLPSQGFQLS